MGLYTEVKQFISKSKLMVYVVSTIPSLIRWNKCYDGAFLIFTLDGKATDEGDESNEDENDSNDNDDHGPINDETETVLKLEGENEANGISAALSDSEENFEDCVDVID